jgi:hypothetical protein
MGDTKGFFDKLNKSSVMTDGTTTATKTFSTTTQQKETSKVTDYDRQINDFSLPSVSSQLYEPDSGVFRHNHLAKRACPKFFKQANKDKDYEMKIVNSAQSKML